MQIAILAVAVSLGTSRKPHADKLSFLGKVVARIALAVALLPHTSSDATAHFEANKVAPVIEWWGLDATAPLSRVQVAGLSSMLGYMAFVEIIRWYIGEAPKKAGQTNGTSNGHTVTVNAVTANGASDNDAAAAAAASTSDLYAQRRELLQKGEGGHNVGLAVLSALMLLGIARSCLVSGKFTSLHAFVCEPFR
eukprot:3635-Heterococcus_DN1.PRE.1